VSCLAVITLSHVTRCCQRLDYEIKKKKKMKRKKKGWRREDGWVLVEGEMGEEVGMPLGAVTSDCMVYLALCERECYIRF